VAKDEEALVLDLALGADVVAELAECTGAE